MVFDVIRVHDDLPEPSGLAAPVGMYCAENCHIWQPSCLSPQKECPCPCVDQEPRLSVKTHGAPLHGCRERKRAGVPGRIVCPGLHPGPGLSVPVPVSRSQRPGPSVPVPVSRSQCPGLSVPVSVSRSQCPAMRFNEKEMIFLSKQPSERAAELGMRGPKKGDVVKKRRVKLVVNFLFYFRPEEEEPMGALLLEQCRVKREDHHTFSIMFLDEAERKYQFECETEDQCSQWMDSIVRASYEFMRKNLIFYRSEIHRLTGKDPLEQYGISEETRFQVSSSLPASSGDTWSM